MDVLKQSKAEPLFVILPVNGEYYDYTGFPKKGRDDYYKRITAQIADNGFRIQTTPITNMIRIS